MARKFTCHFIDRENVNEQLPREVEFRPESWDWSDIGGPDQATIAVNAPVERLHEAVRRLGDLIAIRNESGSVVWFGHCHEVEVAYEGISTRVSLEDVYNRVAVSYVYQAADGSSIQGQTGWESRADSIAKYGTRELLLNFEGEEAEAELFRDNELIRLVALKPITVKQKGTPGATLQCLGPWHRLGWRYYEDLAGVEEYQEEGTGEQTIGASYTATTISFVATDDILDSANGFGELEEEDVITIVGAVTGANNGEFRIDEEGAGAIEVTGETLLVNEAAGASIIVSLGGPKINRIAQSFTLTHNTDDWTVATIAVRAMRVRTPTDNLLCELCSDSGGSPGTVLDSATIPGTSLQSEMTWVEFNLANTQTLTFGTTYWIVIRRDGTATINHYYIVDVNEEPLYAGGQVKVYDGTSWAVRNPAADMPFRVAGKTGTLGQVRRMIEQNSDFGAVTVIDTSNVQTWQYRDGSTLALDEIKKLLDIGTAAGEKLLATVLRDRSVIIYKQPLASDIDPIVDRFGNMTLATGAPLEPGEGVAGQWININVLPLVDAFGARALFVEHSDYSAQNDQLGFETDGSERAWHLTRTKQG